MERATIEARTKQVALRIIRMVAALPKTEVAPIIGSQVLRSATSIGANYREASRAGTKKHFTSILTTALREADETLHRLELLSESKTLEPRSLEDLLDESSQIVAILVASVKSARE